jgi:hypothetical protein
MKAFLVDLSVHRMREWLEEQFLALFYDVCSDPLAAPLYSSGGEPTKESRSVCSPTLFLRPGQKADCSAL